jgi:hypothetical protein
MKLATISRVAYALQPNDTISICFLALITDNLEQDEGCQMISLYPIHNPCSHHLLKNFYTPDCNVNSLILLDEKPCQDFQGH